MLVISQEIYCTGGQFIFSYLKLHRSLSQKHKSLFDKESFKLPKLPEILSCKSQYISFSNIMPQYIIINTTTGGKEVEK